MKYTPALLAALLLMAFSAVPAEASTYVVHGPRTYTRATGAPAAAVETFTVAHPAGQFTLHISNDTVSSASIRVNGVEVVKESDFNRNVQEITRTVQLQATNQLSVELRGKPGERLTLSITGESLDPVLKVHAFEFAPDAPGGKGAPLSAGVLVRIDGADAGITDENGTVTIQVPPGTHEVTGLLPARAIDTRLVTAELGQTLDVDLLLDFDKEVIEGTPLVCDEVTEQILDATFSTLTLRFTRNGGTVPVKTIDAIDLLRPDGSPLAILDSSFQVGPDGVIRATDILSLRAQFNQPAAVTLRVMASDEAGITHENKITFYMGRFRVTGTLAPPPSAPALTLAGIPVQLTVLGTPVSFTTVTGAGGAFEFTRVPRGLLAFSATTLQNEKHYYGQGETLIAYPIAVTLRMRHQVDLINGVPPIHVGPGPAVDGSIVEESEPLPPGAPSRAGTPPPPPWEEAAPETQATGPVTRSVAASSQNLTISSTGVLDVPQGTKKVVLSYNVSTTEWPYWVQQQSIYNDIWSVSVVGGAGGQQLFSITRNVNAQWTTLPPYWQANGSTGTVRQELDVSALAASQPTQLTLLITAMNVGDSALPTYVTATLGADPGLSIDQLTADAPTVSTRNDGSYYSISRPGQTNSFHRTYTLQFTKPDDAQITQVRVELKNASTNQVLMTVLEEGIGQRVVQVNDKTLRVRVSLSQFPSTVSSTPPSTDQIVYSFRLRATKDGQEITSETKDGQPVRPLWRMPDGFLRYSPPGTSPGDTGREEGGDDWCRQFTFTWLTTHQSKLSEINDISGEHGRDIGHQTHARGTDIDIYHFHRFTGSVNAESNYQALLNRARQVLMTGSPQALGDITAWVAAMRTGLGGLVTLPRVHRLYATIGGAVSVTVQQNGQNVNITLPSGWAQTLIQKGQVTASNGMVLQTNLGQWTYAADPRITYNGVHNNHVHITLQ